MTGNTFQVSLAGTRGVKLASMPLSFTPRNINYNEHDNHVAVRNSIPTGIPDHARKEKFWLRGSSERLHCWNIMIELKVNTVTCDVSCRLVTCSTII